MRIRDKEQEETSVKLSSTYLGPVYPEEPKLPDPADDLERIGVPVHQIRVPTTFQFQPAAIQPKKARRLRTTKRH